MEAVNILIDRDRYCGAYSGYPYTAWVDEIPFEVDAGDSTCEEFWDNPVNWMCGFGNTPAEAASDIVKKLGLEYGACFMLPYCNRKMTVGNIKNFDFDLLIKMDLSGFGHGEPVGEPIHE